MTKPTQRLCAQRRLRSAWASTQCDQSLRMRSMGSQGPKLFSCGQRRLIRLGGCPGWSESSLGAHSLCWFCHVAAQIVLSLIALMNFIKLNRVRSRYFIYTRVTIYFNCRIYYERKANVTFHHTHFIKNVYSAICGQFAVGDTVAHGKNVTSCLMLLERATRVFDTAMYAF